MSDKVTHLANCIVTKSRLSNVTTMTAVWGCCANAESTLCLVRGKQHRSVNTPYKQLSLDSINVPHLKKTHTNLWGAHTGTHTVTWISHYFPLSAFYFLLWSNNLKPKTPTTHFRTAEISFFSSGTMSHICLKEIHNWGTVHLLRLSSVEDGFLLFQSSCCRWSCKASELLQPADHTDCGQRACAQWCEISDTREAISLH